MLGKHKFRVGQRVRPSKEGIAACLFRIRPDRSGVVTKVDVNTPTVLWDGRKTTSGYHPDFVEPDKRRGRQ